MSEPLALLVPAPALSFKALGGVFAPLEDAVALSFGAILFPDGAAVTAAEYAGARALLSRTVAPGGAPEVWDDEAKAWRVATAVDPIELKGVPLSPPAPGDAAPWQGVLLGASVKDESGATQIQPAVAHFPQYRLRGLFRARRGADDALGIGPESAPIEFARARDFARFDVLLDPDADTATRARIVLRSGSGRAVGLVEIDAPSGNTMTLSNFDTAGSVRARVRLASDGSIVLEPASGKRVIVAGDLEVEHFRYLPAAALIKQDL